MATSEPVAFVFPAPDEPYLIVKRTAFHYQSGGQGYLLLKQGYPINLSEPWKEVQKIGHRTFGKRNDMLYDITDIAHLRPMGISNRQSS